MDWSKLAPLSLGAAGIGFAVYVFLMPYSRLREELRHRTGDLAAERASARELVKERDRLKSEAAKLPPGEQARAIRAASFRGHVESFTVEMKQALSTAGGGEVVSGPDRILVRLPEDVVFEGRGADISESGENVLRLVGGVLKSKSDVRVLVSAHLDASPVPADLRDLFPTNWELSSARAINAVRFLEDDAKVPGKLLLASAGGERHPPSGASKGTRARRIEIEIEPE